ncbi:RNA polymerase sigma factor [Nonomuraea longicatena]|uniref:RNA polymerase ECF-subfamily sigma factor n=1 Tax=Nonomuraea longicatena TaxID=83682 RepID=A0ABN1QP64_9ACTN
MTTEAERFASVYAATYEQILGYAVRRCEDPEDAADVVAETFATAWRRVHALPDGDEARLWLYGIARKTLANHRRGRVRRQHHSAELDADVADLYAHDPDSAVELSTIARTFRELSDGDRELLSLVAWEGLDHAELAKVLGVSRNAVRIRLHRARKRLSRALRAAGVTSHHLVTEAK